MTRTYYKKKISSPVGELSLIANERSLVALLWEKDGNDFCEDCVPSKRHPILDETEKQLKEYFQGKRSSFDIPLEPEGTKFQLAVWRALREIPFAKTCSYGAIAKRIGRPKASRAVGAANGRNPISIIVPCHRVIGANGNLTGFGGGLKNKKILLDLETKAELIS
jgi:methylated-DNA-[protein]-cysteine S-methyltransferase